MQPQGKLCRFCPWAHRLCGYPKDLDTLIDVDWKQDRDKYTEFLGAVRHLVDKVNRGELTMQNRFKGARLVQIQNEFGEARLKTVEMVQQFRLMVEEKFKAKSYDKWMEENEGKDPLKERRAHRANVADHQHGYGEMRDLQERAQRRMGCRFRVDDGSTTT